MASRAQLERWADEAARAEGVDPRLFRALITAESGWRVDARSPVGATGLTQLMPATGRSLGVTNPLDPRQNLRGGAKYIGQQLRAFKGDPRLALAAYNAGPGAVSKYGGIPPFRETQNYVAKIMSSLGSAPLSSPAPAAGGGGAPAAGGAPMGGGAAPSGSPLEMIAALRSLRGGAAPIRARGYSSSAGATRLAGLQMLKSALSTRMASSAMGSSQPSAGSTEIQPLVDLGDGTFAHPTGGKGAIIGRPGQGTHDFKKSPHNWQSDNAIDFGVPIGSPLYAPSAGIIGPSFGSLGPDSSRFGGSRLTIQGQGGAPSWYMSHMRNYAPGIRPGARVRRGQLIGYSGAANNVPHLHIGVDRGNPLQLLGVK